MRIYSSPLGTIRVGCEDSYIRRNVVPKFLARFLNSPLQPTIALLIKYRSFLWVPALLAVFKRYFEFFKIKNPRRSLLRKLHAINYELCQIFGKKYWRIYSQNKVILRKQLLQGHSLPQVIPKLWEIEENIEIIPIQNEIAGDVEIISVRPPQSSMPTDDGNFTILSSDWSFEE